MHAFFPPFGIYPNNAIVGGSADISVGAALFKHVNRKPGIVIAQHRRRVARLRAGLGRRCASRRWTSTSKLWDEAHRGGLPLIFNFVNNFYGMGGQPRRRDHGLRGARPPRRGRSTPTRCTPSASTATTRWPSSTPSAARRRSSSAAKARCCSTRVTYRFSGHSPSDASSYREKDGGRGLAAGQTRSSPSRGSSSTPASATRRDDRRRCRRRSTRSSSRRIKKAIDLAISPRADLTKAGLPPRADDVLQRARARRWTRRASREVAHAAGGESARQAAGRPQPQRPRRRTASRLPKSALRRRSATRCSRRSSTASTPIRRWSPTARRTATGAARLPSIAD